MNPERTWPTSQQSTQTLTRQKLKHLVRYIGGTKEMAMVHRPLVIGSVSVGGWHTRTDDDDDTFRTEVNPA